jgi:RNA recognition motif-containing protein
MSKIIISNIPKWVSEHVLKEHFGSFGKINNVTLLLDDNLKITGTAEIRFATSENAENAAAAMNNFRLDGEIIKVDATF